MSQEKVILLVQATLLPEHRDRIVALANESLPNTRAEAGVLAFYHTSQQDDPNTLLFIEVFESEAAHAFHREQESTKHFLGLLNESIVGRPVVTRLSELKAL